MKNEKAVSCYDVDRVIKEVSFGNVAFDYPIKSECYSKGFPLSHSYMTLKHIYFVLPTNSSFKKSGLDQLHINLSFNVHSPPWKVIKTSSIRPKQFAVYLPIVTKVHSTIDFPRNICNSCVDKLKDISLSIDIWQNNSRTKKEKEAIEDFEVNMMSACIICSFGCDLMPFEANAKLLQLFRDITNIDMKDEMASTIRNGICSECIDKLEDISSFIRLSLCNDGKLEYAVGRKKYLECETYSDAIGINSSISNVLKLEDVADNDGIEKNQENIDMKEQILDPDLSNSVSKTYRAELATCSQKFTQNLFPKQDSLYPTEEESSQCDWSNKYTTHKSDSREKFQCGSCSKIFARKSNLQSHMFIHTGDKPFKCDYCERSYIQKWDLKMHLRTHTGEKPFKCDFCEKSFARKGVLKTHLRTHTGEKPFKCSICDASFRYESDLQPHMVAHTGEKQFKCDCCEKSFTRELALKNHLRTYTGEKPIRCDICDKSFSQRYNLQIHMLTHTGGKSFKCGCCEKSFSHKARLEIHLRTHTGEKPFKCDRCEKSFGQKQNLKTHLLTHTGGKSFECDRCKKSFKQKGGLKRHLRSHTGEKPYKCDICDKSFTQGFSLRTHMLTHSV